MNQFHIGEFCYRKLYAPYKADFEKIKSELIVDNAYQFQSIKERPLIIDCGSHVGLSIIYFKSRFPKAKIIGFEPDPDNLYFLKENLKNNGFEDVVIVPKALASVEKTVDFWRDNMGISTWGNSIAIPKEPEEAEVVPVETTLLSSYLQDEVDFLKMDIEGSEEQVLQEAANKLPLVRQIELEFHGTTKNNDINNLDRIVTLLEDKGFEVEVEVKDVTKIFLRHGVADRLNFHFAQVRAKNTKN
ncbi:MAG: FkbM family methyltransferase [Oscillatoria sp. SIO1A7]|nr:FkbM family methyltransferase [Oscillatoria sp. SIO1A7]